eukprot:765764-Hanusia_phi.AAC.1
MLSGNSKVRTADCPRLTKGRLSSPSCKERRSELVEIESEHAQAERGRRKDDDVVLLTCLSVTERTDPQVHSEVIEWQWKMHLRSRQQHPQSQDELLTNIQQ